MQVPVYHGLGKKGSFTQNIPCLEHLSVQFASVSHWEKGFVLPWSPLQLDLEDLNTDITI